MPNEHVVADAKRAFECAQFFFLYNGGCSESPCFVNIFSLQKKKRTTAKSVMLRVVLATDFG